MEKKISNLFKGDTIIWMAFLILCLISIVEVFSASSSLTYKSSNYIQPISKHTFTLLVGFLFALLVTHVPCRFFKICTVFLLFISFGTLILVLIFGESINGANRVLSMGGLTFQPSEIAKGTLVLYTAQVLSVCQTPDGAEPQTYRWIFVCLLPFMILIGMENLSTALLIALVVYLMMIIGRVPGRQLACMAGIAAVCVALVLGSVLLLGKDQNEADPQMNNTEVLASQATQEEATPEKGNGRGGFLHRADTWKTRIDDFFSGKHVSAKDYDLDKNAQVAHAHIAIVGSNVWGRWPGNSEERDFLSQAFSDFIYAIIIEETGIEGAALVVFLYLVLLFRTRHIARRCENCFPAFLAMGLALLFAVQAMFNMMVAVHIMPVTGQPLPLISKGGTSTIINCVYIGVILSVSRTAKKNKALQDEEMGGTDNV